MVTEMTLDRPRSGDAPVGEDVVMALERVYGQADRRAIADLFASDYVEYDPGRPSAGGGPAAVEQLLSRYRRAMPDLHLQLIDSCCEGDTVIIHWRGCGTQRGPLEDLPPSGRRVTIRGATVTRFAGGKAVEGWSNWEPASLLRQVAARPQSVTWREAGARRDGRCGRSTRLHGHAA